MLPRSPDLSRGHIERDTPCCAGLIDGLGGVHPGTVIASADGLSAAKAKDGCVALRRQLGHEDASVRYHVVSAGLALERLTPAHLERVSRDKDRDVAALVHKHANK